MTVVYVAVGSALGGACRYFVSILLNSPSGFPWGTLGVNVLGSLAIGLLSGWLAHGTGNAAAIRAFAVDVLERGVPHDGAVPVGHARRLRGGLAPRGFRRGRARFPHLEVI